MKKLLQIKQEIQKLILKQMILKKKIRTILTKRLAAALINKHCILNGLKYFSSDGLQNYLVFILTTRIDWISNNGRYSRIKSLGNSE